MNRGLSYTLATVFVLVVWQGVALAIHNPALPTATAAVQALWVWRAGIAPHLLASLLVIISSIAIGMVLGLPIGLALGRMPKLDRLAAPLVFLLYPIPKVVFVPVLLVLLGLGNAPKIVLIAIVIFFQTIVSTRDAARAVRKDFVDAMLALGMTPWQVAWYLVFPVSLPAVCTAVRINIATAIAILFLAESIAGSSGLGYFIVQMWGRLDYAAMFAGIIALAVLGVVLYESVAAVERHWLGWADGVSAQS
ncbi:MAG: ABC transporter permease subunit [Propionibacteriaceae bacterium]|nr:ABC transporter permease subunit [Propionibacteriaceae bacterium]